MRGFDRMAGMPMIGNHTLINGYLGPWNPVALTASTNTGSQRLKSKPPWVVGLFREDFRVPKCKYRLNLIEAVPGQTQSSPCHTALPVILDLRVLINAHIQEAPQIPVKPLHCKRLKASSSSSRVTLFN
jgi:hypothetical protein